MVGNDWCISILAWAVVDWRISILVVQIRDCSPSGLHWHLVDIMLFDHGHARFWNFNPTILVDFVGVKSYLNNLPNLPCAPILVLINKINFLPERIVPGGITVL